MMQRSFKWLFCAALAAGVLGAAAPADETVYELPLYEVSAFRYPAGADAAPASVAAFTRQDILRFGATTVAGVLEKGAGIRFRSLSGNAAQAEPSLRGFGENSGLRVLVIVDGRKLNRPDMGLLDWSNIPLAGIERIEVLRGPQTALYGNHAVGGVIKITTKTGARQPSGTLTGIAGSGGLRDVRLHCSTPAGSGTLNISLESNHSAGWRENTDYAADSASIRCRLPLGENVSARLGASLLSSENNFPGPLGREDFLERPRRSHAMDQDGSTSMWSADLHLESRPDTDRTLSAQTGFTSRDMSWNLDGVFGDNLIQGVTFSPQFRRECAEMTWSLGGDLFYDTLDFQRYSARTREVMLGDADLGCLSYGVYAHASLDISGTWSANATLRADKSAVRASNAERDPLAGGEASFKDQRRSETGWAATAGATWRRSRGHRFWARLDRLYRYPAADELAAFQGYPLTQPFNHDLKAEKGWSLEAGSDWHHGPWAVSAGFFCLFMDGEISFDHNSGLNTNLAGTRRLGVEASTAWETRRFHLGARYTGQMAEFTEGPYRGKEVYLVPRHQLDLNLAWTPAPRLTVELFWRHTSSQWQGNDFANKHHKMDAWQVLDAIARWRPKAGLSFFLAADNVLNEHYAAAVYSGAYYPAPGTMARAGVTAAF